MCKITYAQGYSLRQYCRNSKDQKQPKAPLVRTGWVNYGTTTPWSTMKMLKNDDAFCSQIPISLSYVTSRNMHYTSCYIINLFMKQSIRIFIHICLHKHRETLEASLRNWWELCLQWGWSWNWDVQDEGRRVKFLNHMNALPIKKKRKENLTFKR